MIMSEIIHISKTILPSGLLKIAYTVIYNIKGEGLL